MRQALEDKSRECDEWRDKYNALQNLRVNENYQMISFAKAVTSLKSGEIPAKLPTTSPLSSDLNDLIEIIDSLTQQTHTASAYLQDGLLGTEINELKSGCWKSITSDINKMIQTTTEQFRSLSDSCLSISKGDLSRKHAATASGEFLQTQIAVNTMADQLSLLVNSIADVRRKVVDEGVLSDININTQNFSGLMRDLLIYNEELISYMSQHFQQISYVVSSTFRGILCYKCTLHANGEILQLQQDVNFAVDRFILMCTEVSRLCREIGSEGKLGGQICIQLNGSWKDMVEDINWMAANFTASWRCVSEVVTAIATGDFSYKMTMDTRGEFDELKQTVNLSIDIFNCYVAEFANCLGNIERILEK